MKHLYLTLFALTFLVACSTSIPKEQLEKNAFIRSGSTNIWSVTSGGAKVSLTAIDGVATTTDNGPVAVKPGKHTVTMECSGKPNSFDISFQAGEIYEYAYGVDGQKGCVGHLFKIN